MSFGEKLVDWYRDNGRDLPWRQTTDPYVIWLSEVILQQTRVEQGMPYFYRFVSQYPTVQSFAEAEEEEILRMWQGLGYYSRARNMHKAAKLVMSQFNGVFPQNYTQVITLPGVGDYTAAAISSFSCNEDRAVLDGNVFRVLARYFGVEEPINTGLGKKMFQTLAERLLPVGHAAMYNQAIMDFGATVCKPKSPLCSTCIFHYDCVALRNDTVMSLPVKQKGKGSRNRYFNYFLVEHAGSILMSKRGEGDVWSNLYELPMIESSRELSMAELIDSPDFQVYFADSSIEPLGKTVKHILSHQNIFARFYRIIDNRLTHEKKANWNYHLLENLDKLAKHKLIFSFMNEYLLN